MQFEFRPDDDDRTAGVVDTFAQQVLTETALLAFSISDNDFNARLPAR
jgi:hypothetical protein